MLGGWAQAVISLGALGVMVAMVVEGLGLPFPGDAVLVLFGFGAARGDHSAISLVAAAVAGYVVGSVISWRIGGTAAASARGAAVRRWLLISDRQWERAQAWLRRHDAWLLIPGRFLPGVRSVSGYAAGAAGMPLDRFLLCTVMGAVLWCGTWVAVGLWFGEHAHEVLHALRSALTWVAVAAALILGLLWYRRRRVRT